MPKRRSPSTPVVVIGCALAAALLVAAAFLVFDVGGEGDGNGATPETAAVPEEADATPVDDRLTSESRLGYSGLGPITLGMSEEEAERAGSVTIEASDGGCSFEVTPHAESGLAAGDVSLWFEEGVDAIALGNPAIRTISGIYLGSTADDVLRTYSNAVESPEAITITSADGRIITFYLDADRRVRGIILARSPEVLEGWSRC